MGATQTLKSLQGFLAGAEAEVRSLTSLYSSVGRNADALSLYFGEDPTRCPFEQDNSKQLELEKKKTQKEAEVEKGKVTNSKKESQNNTQSPADGAPRKLTMLSPVDT